jgi:hypothetical protein
MPLIKKRSRRFPKVLVLALAAIGGAIALSGSDVKRYLRMRSM